MDTRKAKFHPQKNDIVETSNDSSSQSSWIADKVATAALACDCGSKGTDQEERKEDSIAPVERPESVTPQQDEGVHDRGTEPQGPVDYSKAEGTEDKAPRLGAEVEGDKGREEAKAEESDGAQQPEDLSASPSPFDNIRERLRMKQEEWRSKGVSGIDENLQLDELTSDFENKVSVDEGAQDVSPVQQLDDEVQAQQEERNLAIDGEEGAEDSHSEPAQTDTKDEEQQQEFADALGSLLPTASQDINLGGDEQDFADAPLSFQQDDVKSSDVALTDATPPEAEAELLKDASLRGSGGLVAEEAFLVGKAMEREGSSSSSSSAEQVHEVTSEDKAYEGTTSPLQVSTPPVEVEVDDEDAKDVEDSSSQSEEDEEDEDEDEDEEDEDQGKDEDDSSTHKSGLLSKVQSLWKST